MSTGKLLSPQPANGVRTFFLAGSERDQTVFGDVLAEDRPLVIVDLPATGLTLMRKIVKDYGFFDLAHERGYNVTFLCPITPDPASAAAVSGALDLDPLADVVVVKNLAFGEEQDFIVWTGSERDGIPEARGRQVLRERGGCEITMPKLNAGTVALIGAHKLTFTAAAGNDSPLILPRRSQSARWLSAMQAEFERVGVVLAFSPPARSDVKSKRIIFSLGDKGGSGKSFAIRALIECHRAAGHDPLLLDGDASVGHILTYYGIRENGKAQ